MFLKIKFNTLRFRGESLCTSNRRNRTASIIAPAHSQFLSIGEREVRIGSPRQSLFDRYTLLARTPNLSIAESHSKYHLSASIIGTVTTLCKGRCQWKWEWEASRQSSLHTPSFQLYAVAVRLALSSLVSLLNLCTERDERDERAQNSSRRSNPHPLPFE
jgi:hypothetical protein